MNPNPSTHYEIAILGSGFSGSLLAWILASQGRRVVLIDAARHPRFAIGESSTPIADLLLRKIGHQYGLQPCVDLSTYPSWQQAHPELRCGKKRGFSYFHHDRGKSYSDDRQHHHSLMVAASQSDATADTHWYRSDVDCFFARQATEAGAVLLEQTAVENIQWQSPVVIHLDQAANPGTLTADMVVNASGRSDLGDVFATRDCTEQLKTRTWCRFTHLHGVRSWTELLQGMGLGEADWPFDPDNAAQHHLTPYGWLWCLRMNEDVTSVGWTSPLDVFPRSLSDRATDDRATVIDPLGDFPSIGVMLGKARLAETPGRWIEIARVQRYRLPVSGLPRRSEAWVSLPTATATVDPLHSTGIAHGLAGVDRLASILLDDVGRRAERLASYETAVEQEVEMIDLLSHLGYQTMHDLPLFATTSMLYFAAAIRSEESLARAIKLGEESPETYWLASDPYFGDLVKQTLTRVEAGESNESIQSWLRPRLEPYNTAGLMDPAVHHRYHYTAATKPSVT